MNNKKKMERLEWREQCEDANMIGNALKPPKLELLHRYDLHMSYKHI